MPAKNKNRPMSNDCQRQALAAAAGSGVFVIERDRNPQPWEDWASPYMVIVGTSEYAETVRKKLAEENPTHLYSMSECTECSIHYQNK